jgi:hypothetical protein
MVNFGLNSASILGIFLAVAGAALYFLRSVRPELARDHDIFFAAVGLLCGFILLFQGWRLDPILQFGQLLLTGSAIFFAVESIRLRGVATEQAKRSTRIVDEDRPVSRVYQYEAELDDLEPLEEERPIPRPQIRGTRDARSTRTDEYEDEAPRRYRRNEDDEYPRRSSSRGASAERLGQGDRPSKRRPRPENRSSQRPEADEWGYSPQQTNDDWETGNRVNKSPRSTSSNGSSRSDRPENFNPEVSSRPKKRRPPQDSAYRQDANMSATPSDYVDYKPIDQPDDEQDNSANFDES